jgi:hypothetical protein
MPRLSTALPFAALLLSACSFRPAPQSAQQRSPRAIDPPGDAPSPQEESQVTGWPGATATAPPEPGGAVLVAGAPATAAPSPRRVTVHFVPFDQDRADNRDSRLPVCSDDVIGYFAGMPHEFDADAKPIGAVEWELAQRGERLSLEPHPVRYADAGDGYEVAAAERVGTVSGRMVRLKYERAVFRRRVARAKLSEVDMHLILYAGVEGLSGGGALFIGQATVDMDCTSRRGPTAECGTRVDCMRTVASHNRDAF